MAVIIVIKWNCIAVRTGKCLSAVCPIVFGVEQKDASSIFSFNFYSEYAVGAASAQQQGL
jgi:hypothetical protein